MHKLRFADVTVLVGDNGTGKSTIVEALAVAAGFNPEGGSRNLNFKTHDTHSLLHRHLEVRWRTRPTWGWFLRAETFYGMATHIANDDPVYGVRSMFPDFHAESHGESFIDLHAGAQFIVATHSPILMAYPNAALYEIRDDGIHSAQYDDLEVIALWRRFLLDPPSILGQLFDE